MYIQNEAKSPMSFCNTVVNSNQIVSRKTDIVPWQQGSEHQSTWHPNQTQSCPNQFLPWSHHWQQGSSSSTHCWKPGTTKQRPKATHPAHIKHHQSETRNKQLGFWIRSPKSTQKSGPNKKTYIVATDGSVVLLGHCDAAVVFAPVLVSKIKQLQNKTKEPVSDWTQWYLP